MQLALLEDRLEEGARLSLLARHRVSRGSSALDPVYPESIVDEPTSVIRVMVHGLRRRTHHVMAMRAPSDPRRSR